MKMRNRFAQSEINSYLCTRKLIDTMTREEAIKRWEAIIPTVFRAEKAIRPRLLEVLTEHEDDPTTGAELYIRLIAEEIVSKLTDQQLQTME